MAVKVGVTACFKEDLPLTLCAEYSTRPGGVHSCIQPASRFEAVATTHQGAISSSRRSLVSTMLVAAIAPRTLTPANIRKTE